LIIKNVTDMIACNGKHLRWHGNTELPTGTNAKLIN